MSKIVIATFGSLGDVHPFIAIALELRRRGHQIIFATIESYREKIELLGFEFRPIRPTIDPENREEIGKLMDEKTGSEYLIRELLFPNLREQFEDLTEIVKDADLLINGEAVYSVKSVVEKTKIKWISTTLAPISLFSGFDPSVYPAAAWLKNTYFLGANFHYFLLWLVKQTIKSWYSPYKKFRRELGLDENHDPIFHGKYSDLLNLVMFSEVLSAVQKDWPKNSLQTGFCFYDGNQDMGKMPEKLEEFLNAGEPPIVFTLGSAAVMSAGNFFEESIKAAKMLNRRAVMLYGIFNLPPEGLDEKIVGFDYAPYSQVFSRAACVVHQGGIGTTSQVLRAGVPMIVMPYSHDQPDNAYRCERLGVARTIHRSNFNAETVAQELKKIFSDLSYRANAVKVKSVLEKENGVNTACDAIEKTL